MAVGAVCSWQRAVGRVMLAWVIVCGAISCNDSSSVNTQGSPAEAKEDHGFQFHDGDIIFQTSESAQSKAIQLATHSPYSHVGIVYKEKGKYFVYEAIQPVTVTPLESFIARGKDGHYVVKRLKHPGMLTDDVLAKMKSVGKAYKGKDYDLYFGWSDDRIYCSELVYKIYMEGAGIEIGKLQKLEEFDLSSPLVKKKLEERYGNKIPYSEPVVSPASMFDDADLESVAEQ